jgi:hypothetical protein
MMNRVTVAVVPSRAQADLVVGLLNANGVQASYFADDAGGQEPQLQLNGVRVTVAIEDAAAAQEILSTEDTSTEDTTE